LAGKPCALKTGLKEGPKQFMSYYVCYQKERCSFVLKTR